jgi:hypothetical protein
MHLRLYQTIRIAGLVRDIGVILGVPVLLGIGLHLWDLETKAHEAQIKAAEAQVKAAEAQVKSNEAQMKAMEAQNALLTITSYDRTAATIEGMRKTYLAEREVQDKQIKEQDLLIKSKEEEINALKNGGTKEAVDKAVAEYAEAVGIRQKLIEQRLQNDNAELARKYGDLTKSYQDLMESFTTYLRNPEVANKTETIGKSVDCEEVIRDPRAHPDSIAACEQVFKNWIKNLGKPKSLDFGRLTKPSK